MEARTVQVGRDFEREKLTSVVRDAAEGRAAAMLVAGEPGIGKTSLVEAVTAGPAAAGHLVLWGRCLRFAAESSPYLPIGQALTQWHRRADEVERARVLAGAEQLASIVPSLGEASGAVDTARMVPLVAAVLDRIAERSPVVLVLDDVQWADGSSLDALAYVLAGFDTGQRLSVLVTYRDTDLGDGHRLHAWLADVTRLPGVSSLRLERLRYADAEELVARLRTDGGASRGFAAEVFGKADGNPYYTALLVRATGEPDSTPDSDLRRALLSSWHGLDPGSRELLQVIALGGRPVAMDLLERLVVARGGIADQVAGAVAAAMTAGLLTLTPDGSAWFHHPLIAEVVATTLSPAARRQVHREYVVTLNESTDLTPATRAAHLALHHDGAGNVDDAFMWSLRAADEAAAVRGYAEVFDHLHRACRLWEHAGEDARAAPGDRIELWRRASESAWSAGEHALAVRLREEAVALAEAENDPLRAIRLRLPLAHLRMVCGIGPRSYAAEAGAILEISSVRYPRSVEHCIALAQLALGEHWSDDATAEGQAETHADEAVWLAQQIGSVESLAWALAVRSQNRGDVVAALADAEQAVALAREVGDPQLQGKAAVWTANVLQDMGRPQDAIDFLVAAFRELVARGSVQDALWSMPGFAASTLVVLGRFEEARELLRELLSHRLPPDVAADVRSVAALLALKTGHNAAGRAHLDRAQELRPGRRVAGEMLPFNEAESMWALGQPRTALDLVGDLMSAVAVVDPKGADELLVVASRAAADLSELPGRREEAVALLERIEQQRGWEPPPFTRAVPEDVVSPARSALFAADRARCQGDTATTSLWRAAAAACEEAGLLWHQALASYRLARALLRERRARGEAASALRRAAQLATDLSARPILRDVEELARQAHLPQAEPTPVPATDDHLPDLTPREGEVLSHVVAGRTYAEIAQALVISEKTVSVHVSNLLRKTGTGSRIELTELVRRGRGGRP